MKIGPFYQPALNHTGFMGSVIVENYMNFLTIGKPVLDEVEELTKLDTTVTFMASTNHFARSRIECCEEGKGTKSSIIMGPAFGLSRSQGQERLSPVERLYLALFINAQYHSLFRRVQV